MKSTKVGFVSLGCPKALVDSERILTRLKTDGYSIAPSYEDADLVVVNTCGFIDSAIAESLESIGEAVTENGKVIVTGCLGVREDEIRKQYPQVLEVTGPHACDQVVESVHRHLGPAHNPYTELIPSSGIKLTPPHYAYLKISEGCNHRCTFCIIPSMRGDLVSRPIDEVMREAETLVESGVRELLVISQDTSAYGTDLGYRQSRWRNTLRKSAFFDLTTALAELGVWVRLHYVYPYPHVDKVIPLMADGRILPYLDIPFQHASPQVLKRMKRPAASERTLQRIQAWRETCPELTIRSTFIVGFPGETEADFEELLDFLREARLDRVGCFEYSPVTGAAANQLADPVPEEIRQERKQRLMEVQSSISRDRLSRMLGRSETVLIDSVDEQGATARSARDAPEIDGLVFIDDAHGLSPGDLVEVVIDETGDHDVWAHPA